MTTLAAARVLFVHQSSDLYGSDRVLLDIATALNRAGGEAIVVLPGGGPLVEALQRRGVEVHAASAGVVLKLSRGALSAAGLLRLATAVPGSVAALDRIVAGRPIDRVHSNTLAVLGGALWSRWRHVPHLWHVHEMVEHPRAAARALPALVRLFADDVVCNSHATQAWLLGAQPALAARTQVIHNGIEDLAALPRPARFDLHDTFRPAGAALSVGLVGRINRMKGHALLLDAAERLFARGRRDLALVFIGNAAPGQEPLEAALRERVAASPLAERVVMTGFMPAMADAYAALDIVCVPSTEAEAFGLVAVEAMAARRPLLAARIGGLPEVVEHGRNGLLHEPGDAEDLAWHLAALLDNAAGRARFGAAGRLRFENEFTVRGLTDRLLALYARPDAAAPAPRTA